MIIVLGVGKACGVNRLFHEKCLKFSKLWQKPKPQRFEMLNATGLGEHSCTKACMWET